MALTAMPGWTATDMFARPPRAVVRHAPAGGVMMHAACTFIPGWTWTTAFGGRGTVAEVPQRPLKNLELASYENGDFRTIGHFYVRDIGADTEGDRPRRPDQNLGAVGIQDADAAGVPVPAHPVAVDRHLRRRRHESHLHRVTRRVVRDAELGRGNRNEVILGGQMRHAERGEPHMPPAGSGQVRAARCPQEVRFLRGPLRERTPGGPLEVRFPRSDDIRGEHEEPGSTRPDRAGPHRAG